MFPRLVWLLFALLLLGLCFGWRYCYAPPATAQEPPCYSIEDCSSLRLLIVRDSAYAPPGCPSAGAACSNADPFYQISYRVYLRYVVDASTPDSLLTFDLDHARLNARVRLNSVKGASFIDTHASYACFIGGPGAAWDLDEKVIWDGKTQNEIALDFMNEIADSLPCGASDARIPFSPTAGQDALPSNLEPCPAGKKCAYAYLFPVVVQAYPGDIIQLECEGLEYQSSDPNVAYCSPSFCAVNTNNSGFNGIFPDTIPLAPTPSGDNAGLLIRLSEPDTSTVSGAYDVHVEIVNTGTASITVNYLEFMTELDIDVIIPDVQFSGNEPLEVKKVPAGGSAYSYFMHYVIPLSSGLTLAPNAGDTLSTITVGPPVPFNQNWSGQIALINEDESRVRSESECSRLILSDTTRTIDSSGGDDPCGNSLPDDVFFTIRGKVDTSGGCTPPEIWIGFYTTQTSDIQLVFDNFFCEVLFDWSGDLSISNVAFSGAWECGEDGCYPNCYEVDNGNEKLLRVATCKKNNLVLNAGNNYEAFFKVEFSGVGCVNAADLITLRYLRENTQDPCVPLYDNTNEGIPVCGRQINGNIATEDDKKIEDVEVTLAQIANDSTCNNSTCPPDQVSTNKAGDYLFCACAPCSDFVVTPYKNNDPLNGVSTFDLVLINKHILGIEPLSSPYKMIAADANNSQTIQPSDLLLLRKLILGLITAFPTNTSWRFVQADYSFPNPSNPFENIFPESDTLPPFISAIDFIGIKIGDVNLNAVTNSRPINRPLTTIGWPKAVNARSNGILTIPVLYTGHEPLQALQMALRFDPAVLELIGPSQGDLPATNADNFGLVKATEGEIRMLWMPGGAEPEQYIQPGAVLFYLSFRVRGAMPDSGLPLRIDDTVLESLAWQPNGLEYRLQDAPVDENAGIPLPDRATPADRLENFSAACRPNPTANDAVFSIRVPQTGQGRIALFDAFGKLIFMRKVELQAGEQEIPAPEVANISPGVYVWKVFAGGEKISGHLVKQ